MDFSKKFRRKRILRFFVFSKKMASKKIEKKHFFSYIAVPSEIEHDRFFLIAAVYCRAIECCACTFEPDARRRSGMTNVC